MAVGPCDLMDSGTSVLVSELSVLSKRQLQVDKPREVEQELFVATRGTCTRDFLCVMRRGGFAISGKQLWVFPSVFWKVLIGLCVSTQKLLF